MHIKMSHARGEMEEEMYALYKANYGCPLIFLYGQTACNAFALPRKDCNSAARQPRLFEDCEL